MEGKDDDASSVASDDSFVVVIPDCFDPGVPLLNQVNPPHNARQEPSVPVVDQQQQPNMQQSTINLMTFDEPAAPPNQPACPLQGNSEPHPQEDALVKTEKQTSKSSPQRPPPLTPIQMLANPRAHILGRNPWQVGAAFIDSTMHQIDKNFGQPSGIYASRPSAPPKAEVNPQNTEAPKNDEGAATAGNDTDDDDEFKVVLQIVIFVLIICVCCFCRIALLIC